MGSNNQSITEFEKLKDALFGGYGFKPDPHTSHSFAISSNAPTTGPITHIHNATDRESILLNKETFDNYISNCADIIKKKKEPYYTLVKNNLKTVFFSTDLLNLKFLTPSIALISSNKSCKSSSLNPAG